MKIEEYNKLPIYKKLKVRELEFNESLTEYFGLIGLSYALLLASSFITDKFYKYAIMSLGILLFVYVIYLHFKKLKILRGELEVLIKRWRR